MRKYIIALCLLSISIASSAQDSKFSKPEDDEQPRRGLFDRKKKAQENDERQVRRSLFGGTGEKKVIDEKYLAGACPEVNGKVQWARMYDVPGKSAQEIYDLMYTYMKGFVKGEEQTKLSNISVVNKEDHQIGVRLQEILVFEKKPLSLDQTKFNYHLIIDCSNGKCTVTMRNMSYAYEEDRGGGQFPAEDMISDKEALNKKKDGFQKGGVQKFRTKTIDRKDLIFENIGKYLSQK